MRRKYFTPKELDIIATALAFIAAGDLDECQYDAKDFDAVLDKINKLRTAS